MSELNINVEGGSSTKLLTAGKYCPEDIIITASGGGGGGGELEPIELTGDCGSALRGKIGTFAVNTLGNKISTNKIYTAINMFYENMCEKIPFEINMDDANYRNMDYLFQYCENLKEVPKINNVYPGSVSKLFGYCYRLRNLPDNFGSDWNYDRLHTYNYAGASQMFNSCYSLRNVPKSFISNLWGIHTSYSSGFTYQAFQYCYSLDEVQGFPVPQGKISSSNAFYDTVRFCSRLKEFTFDTNEDGTPKTASFTAQLFMFSDSTGYLADKRDVNRILNYNSGITADKEVKDDATYQALKNDADWFTLDINYSRYNHDSAVNTINTLPDTSAAGGSNRITFKGDAGAKTDGGAINTLTDAEIAVAAAKGWTVVLV